LEDAFICGKIFFHILLQVEDFDLFVKTKNYTLASKSVKTVRKTFVINVAEKLANQTNKLEGSTFVVSGVFTSVSRNELKKLIEDNGGKVSSSISSKTSYVVAGDNMGPSKKTKAESLNIPILSEEEFLSMIR